MCAASVPDARRLRNNATLPQPPPAVNLPRSSRIDQSAVFREAFDQGVRAVGSFMVVWLRNGNNASLRLGVIASKRTFRRAVDRSRAKRLIREAFRLNRWRLQGRYDVVIVARRRILEVSRPMVEKDLMHLARRLRLLPEP